MNRYRCECSICMERGDEIERLQDAKRAALKLADERAIEANGLRQGREWRLIETAPKMKTILLFASTLVDENGRVLNWKMATGCWHSGYENDDKHTPWTWGGHQLAKYDVQPTHWQPLPEPPVNT